MSSAWRIPCQKAPDSSLSPGHPREGRNPRRSLDLVTVWPTPVPPVGYLTSALPVRTFIARGERSERCVCRLTGSWVLGPQGYRSLPLQPRAVRQTPTRPFPPAPWPHVSFLHPPDPLRHAPSGRHGEQAPRRTLEPARRQSCRGYSTPEPWKR